MVQKSIDSKVSDSGKEAPAHEKQLQISAKKTALRDLQNDNRLAASNCTGRGPSSEFIKVSSNNKPSPVFTTSPPRLLSSTSNTANGHLVYIRRKSDADIAKSSPCDSSSIKADYQSKLGQLAETVHLKSHVKELQNHCFPAFSPSTVVFPMNANGWKNLQWEHRYHQLELLLNKLNQSDQQDYLQVLRSLSSVELSRHAVELEKRSIHLSFEEAKELQRVGVLNVLGTPVNNIKLPLAHQDGSEM
ncbi:uncharacterized protein LOC111794586 isoform X2 [Cucurbita pepo subsp. pepo]|uniref:uncharacterized protein LOC111794586 isoform X2 n=1 Tax=Cucurbita pepo subsp. pepo TaxID=3664 RepID=UPI000C9D73C2|nr:uncharacterized protein LOC111794586 isoform X2 [Cucurbita pepo subsp. pepo]